MKKILTYGTFEFFHYGHLELLRRAKKLGDHLTVGLSSDEFNRVKGKKCYQDYFQRCEILKAICYVDEVIEENCWEQKILDIQKLNIDCFVMGNDWQGKFDFLSEYCEVIYLPRTPAISTTEIIELIRNS